ncbi:cyclic AMP-dependent transcription factor ATF-7 [Aplysia californica]|uniref:Cyclic AMP-dependent transcription factor ATF-7 n=1 Tax=Aplysia californica TaxID=6500 RepID=A0ABM0JTQ6_APLCA|nr:cyclic AMP-dependent transcription factor ATF-7 [Aplysia californica]XP_035826395.1 cyclic AMP-dependent transcription factor ATF-7 [Aplysia californica]
MNDDKPFVCPVDGCGMRFTNEDHLNVHSKKHEMSLALNAGEPSSSSSPAHHFLDQTPTPTKFLKNYEEISLFQELSKNPFDDAYKKALDSDVVAAPLPGPQTGELNTPTLILTDTLKASSVVAPSPLTLGDKLRGSEPPKPSPLAKSSTSGTAILDLSGKTVMAAHAPPVTAQDVKRNLAARLARSQATTPDREENQQAHLSGSTVPASAAGLQMKTMTLGQQPSEHSSSQLLGLSSPASALTTALGPDLELTQVKEEPAEFIEAAAAAAISSEQQRQQHQQCTMQVLLQLPTGETVPVSIPATINKLQYLGDQSEVKHPVQQQTANIHPAPSKAGAASSQSTTMAVKQRLKAQLRNQVSPTSKMADHALTPTNSAFVPASAAASIPSHSAGGQQVILTNSSPVMMVDSPGSEVNLSDSSDYSIDSKRQKMSPENGDSEERRRKFLERNRAAAARCRQKRKHWISNLEKKADELSSTNARLQNEVKLLRGEVAQLKTLLLAHKDCPVTQQQKSQGQLQHVILSDPSLASQELAQVVPTADPSSAGHEQLQLGQTIVTFLQEPVLDPRADLQAAASKRN